MVLTSAAINLGWGCWTVSLLLPSGNLCGSSPSSCWDNTTGSGTCDELTSSLSCYQSVFVFCWQTILAVAVSDYGPCDISNALRSVYELCSCGSCPYQGVLFLECQTLPCIFMHASLNILVTDLGSEWGGKSLMDFSSQLLIKRPAEMRYKHSLN